MIHNDNLPKVLGPKYVPGARYCMIESNSSGRGGALPARRQATAINKLVNLDPAGHWVRLGEYGDPEVSTTRSCIIYRWEPKVEATPTPNTNATEQPLANASFAPVSEDNLTSKEHPS